MCHATIRDMPSTEAAELASAGGKRVDDAAAYIGVSRVKLYELMNTGEVRFLKIGKRRIIPVAELTRFLAERLAAATK